MSLVVATAALGALAAIWMVERALALAWMLLRWQAQRERIGTVGLADDGARRRGRHGPRGRGPAVTADRHVAESDCEEIRPGLIGQPANTVEQPGVRRGGRARSPGRRGGGGSRRGPRSPWPRRSRGWGASPTTVRADGRPRRCTTPGWWPSPPRSAWRSGERADPCRARPVTASLAVAAVGAAHAEPHRRPALLVPQPAPGPRSVPRAGGGGARRRRRATLTRLRYRATGRTRAGPRARPRRRPTPGRRSGRRCRSRRT